MNSFRVTIVQTDLIWEDPGENRSRIEKLINSSDESSDAILLPEMFTTGFTMNSSGFAEDMEGPSASWMKRIAAERSSAIGGSIIIREGDRVFNRFLWVTPGGEVKHYDKRHLFFAERESNAYSKGMERLVVNHRGMNILPAICYDLRFPVWLRNRRDYEAIFLVANWPAARREVWHTLLQARAIENQCYIAAVNRTGTDGNGIQYHGESLVIDPKGRILHQSPEDNSEVATVTLDIDSLMAFREKFPVWLDADDFEIKP